MPRRAGLHAFEGGENRLVLAADLLAVLAVDLRDPLEQLGKSRQVVARLLGKIGPAEKRSRATTCRDFPSCSSGARSEEHTSELQSLTNLVCRLLLDDKDRADDTQL